MNWPAHTFYYGMWLAQTVLVYFYQIKLLGNVVIACWERWRTWENTSHQKAPAGFWPVGTISIKGTTTCPTQSHCWELCRTKTRWGSHTRLCLVPLSHCILENLTTCITAVWKTYYFVSITLYIQLASQSAGCWGIKSWRFSKTFFIFSWTLFS